MSIYCLSKLYLYCVQKKKVCFPGINITKQAHRRCSSQKMERSDEVTFTWTSLSCVLKNTHARQKMILTCILMQQECQCDKWWYFSPHKSKIPIYENRHTQEISTLTRVDWSFVVRWLYIEVYEKTQIYERQEFMNWYTYIYISGRYAIPYIFSTLHRRFNVFMLNNLIELKSKCSQFFCMEL